MAKIIFISATDTGVGKTFALKYILTTLLKKGIKAFALKPIETGFEEQKSDSFKIFSVLKKFYSDIKLDDINFYRFPLAAAPFVAKGSCKIDIDLLKEKIVSVSNKYEILIVEGAGGLYVPIEKKYFMIDLIKDLNAKVLFITPAVLGCINQTILSLKALEEKNIEFLWCVNLYGENDFFKITYPFYKSYFKKILFLKDDLSEIINYLL